MADKLDNRDKRVSCQAQSYLAGFNHCVRWEHANKGLLQEGDVAES
jgi:hypothetical protein